MNEDNKSIKCDVESCKFNDNVENYCTLNEIMVSSTSNSSKTHKKETICDSFKERNNI